MCHSNKDKINLGTKVHDVMLAFVMDIALYNEKIIMMKHNSCPQCEDDLIGEADLFTNECSKIDIIEIK